MQIDWPAWADANGFKRFKTSTDCIEYRAYLEGSPHVISIITAGDGSWAHLFVNHGTRGNKCLVGMDEKSLAAVVDQAVMVAFGATV